MTNPEAAPEISAIIVAFRSQGTIAACLDSLFDRSSRPVEAVVVDNSPDTATAEAVAAFTARRPQATVRLIPRPDNTGFAGGCNLGASQARGRFFLFLNPDALLLGDTAGILADFLDARPQAEVVGPQIRDTSGAVAVTCRRLPTLGRVLLDATGLDRVAGGYRMSRFDHRRRRRVDQVMGACFCVRADDFRLRGGFDERFFIYFEEVDYCRRVLDSGREVWFEPAAAIGHVGGASCEHPAQLARMTAMFRDSRTRYFDKHFGLPGRIGIRLLNRLEGLAKAVILGGAALATGNARRREKARGFWHVARGRRAT